MQKILSLLVLLILVACQEAPKNATETKEKPTAPVAKKQEPAAYTLAGKPLYAKEPSKKLLEKYEMHKANYEKDPSADNLIWYARFIAYQGKYKEAIEVFTKGIKEFPDDARFYRHRGHRYISMRKYDEAIVDFQKAATLIQGKENEIEPDGMPNAKNIPVSTLHGNIYYHLGLAYYLKHDFPNALAAYQKSLEASSNADNLVSTSNWLYMILRRMDQTEAAEKVLEKINKDLPVIENFSYHNITLFYKGLVAEEEILKPKWDAEDYAIANWHFYNGNKEKAKALMEGILERNSWGSFAHLAAEKDYLTHFSQN
jgi:tetratricopeptide (TPR) repeat protein